jgi:hypothetical protein
MSPSKQDVGARVSCYPHQGDTGGSRLKGNSLSRKGPARHRGSPMYVHRSCKGLFSGLLHPGLSVKLIKIMIVCSTNELMYDHACYEYVYDYGRLIPCTIMFKNKSTRCYKSSSSHV